MRGPHCAVAVAGILAAVLRPTYAADMPAKMPIGVAMAPYDWSGLYLGAHAGYAWSRADATNINGNVNFPAGLQHGIDLNGGLAGVQLGYNYQFPASNWLVGIEGEFSWSGMDGDSTEPSPVSPATRLNLSHGKVNWLATATGRLGYAYSNWLLFAKGGAAWAHQESNSTTVDPSAGNLLISIVTGDDTRLGWTIGAGVEWGFWQNWSARLEYDFMDFGTKTETNHAAYFNGATGLDPLLRDVDFKMSVVKLGINYRFNGH